jgi:hypothetical protein
MTFGEKLINFYLSLSPEKIKLPESIEIMNPYQLDEIISLSRLFYEKYFSDDHDRTFIFGINPGRFGAGVTGITFTDPVRLEKVCGIPNQLAKRQELSSVFIYEMIDAYGGPEKFYSDHFLSAVCPLGFIRNRKNLNYYDDRKLEQGAKGFILETLRKQIDFGAKRDFCICLGEGKNFDFLKKLNDEHGFFRDVIPLAHPRFIMQYRLKQKEQYLSRYLEVLNHGNSS